MSSYSRLVFPDGSTRSDMVLRDDAVLVLTDLPGDADSDAYRVWLAAGNAPGAAVPMPQERRLSFLDFLGLLTPLEQAAVVGSADPRVKVFTLMAANADVILLSDARVRAGIGLCQSLGLVTADRAAAILAGTAPAAT